MARAGHDVTAIDPDPFAIELAERSTPDRRGRLAFHQGNVATWGADEAGFDVIVTSRALHHVPEPAAALERIHHWLRPGGQLVCVDFLHDRFDRRDARWLAQVRGLLEATGSHPCEGRLPADPSAAVERIEWEWEQDHVVDQDLNRSAAIEEPLSRWFPTHARSWHPYLYWDILEVLDVPDPATEKATATLIADWEAALLTAGELSPCSCASSVTATPASARARRPSCPMRVSRRPRGFSRRCRIRLSPDRPFDWSTSRRRRQ
jgi:SAM-dependent methyltransferase